MATMVVAPVPHDQDPHFVNRSDADCYSDVSLFFTINFFIALAFIVLGKSRINEFFNDMGKKLRDMGPMGALIPCTAVSEYRSTSVASS